jgi:hypothetical protein
MVRVAMASLLAQASDSPVTFASDRLLNVFEEIDEQLAAVPIHI